MKTATEWLAMGDELALKLAEVLTPGKVGEHDWEYCDDKEWVWNCLKCGATFKEESDFNDPCPVPDPITLDWNTAMKWRDKTHENSGDWFFYFFEVCQAANLNDSEMLEDSQPKHYLIAAALAVKETT